MAVDPTVLACGKTRNHLATGGIKVGQLVYDDGTRLVAAAASAATTAAMYVVTDGHAVSTDERVTVAKWAIFEDADLAYTVAGLIYLSETAGAFTQTRPTTVDALKQVVGRALSATRYEISVKDPYEQPIDGIFVGGLLATAGPIQLDSGDFIGMSLKAAADAVNFTARVPANAVALISAHMMWCIETAIQTGTTYTVDVSAAHHSDVHDAVSDGITATDWGAATTADDIVETDISAAFDGAGVIEPDKILGIAIAKAAEAAGGEDPIVLGVRLVFRCV